MKNRRSLKGFPESFPGVFIGVVEDKGDVFSCKYYKRTYDATIVLNKTSVKVIETKVALYPSHIVGVSLVLNYIDFL